MYTSIISIHYISRKSTNAPSETKLTIFVTKASANFLGSLITIISLITNFQAYLHHELFCEYENKVFWSSDNSVSKFIHKARMTNELYIAEMIIIRFAGWISGRIVSLQPDTDIQKLLSNWNRIQNRISETLSPIFRRSRLLEKVAYCTIVNLLSSESSFQPSVPLPCLRVWSAYSATSVPSCNTNPIPTLNLLMGHAKFVSVNLLMVWQDRALSVYIKDVVYCVPIPGLTLAMGAICWGTSWTCPLTFSSLKRSRGATLACWAKQEVKRRTFCWV